MSATVASTARTSKQHPSTIAHVAVAVNGYPEGEDAVVLGDAIARATAGDLLLIGIHPEPLVVRPEELNWTSMSRQAHAMLTKTRASLSPEARIAVETDLSVARGLKRVVEHQHRDLLVVGSSRRAPEGTVRIGSRTRQLLSEVECALAIAPRGLHTRPAPPLRRIGVGFDGGPESIAALAMAQGLAGAIGATLQVCGVVDDRVPMIGWSAIARAGAAAPRWEDTVLAAAGKLRTQAQAATGGTASSIKVTIKRGRPAEALLGLSREVDLLVVGSRRWGAAARLLFGSTGEALAHGAHCPLLIVPRPCHD